MIDENGKPLVFNLMLKTLLSRYVWVQVSVGTPEGRNPTKGEVEVLKQHIEIWLKSWEESK